MTKQYEICLPQFRKGFHLITHHILKEIKELPEFGIIHIHIKHTSAGICLNENADPTVLTDFNSFFTRLVPENTNYFVHTDEGSDDMPAHIKASLIGSSVSIPISNFRPNLGTWQGVYLGEFRNYGGNRKLVVTVMS